MIISCLDLGIDTCGNVYIISALFTILWQWGKNPWLCKSFVLEYCLMGIIGLKITNNLAYDMLMALFLHSSVFKTKQNTLLYSLNSMLKKDSGSEFSVIIHCRVNDRLHADIRKKSTVAF